MDWLGFVTYFLAMVVGTFLGILLASLFPEQWKNYLYFVKRNVALRFRRPNINLTLLSRVTLPTALPLSDFLRKTKSETRGLFIPTERGSRILFSPSGRSCNISAEISPFLDEDDSEGDLEEEHMVYAYNVILTTNDARYKILKDNLTDLIAEHTNIRELLSRAFPGSESKIGKATLEVELNKPPTVLAYLHKLDIMSLDTKKDDLEISFTGRRVEIRGTIGAKIANTVKELVTWYY